MTDPIVVEVSNTLPSPINVNIVDKEGPPGPPGPQGPVGPPGVGGGISYEHNQTVASTDWVIAHGLNTFPSVTVIDSAGEFFLADVEYVDRNNLIVHFTASVGGVAYLN